MTKVLFSEFMKKKKRIIIIEDDLNILEAMQMILEDEGYEVVGLTNGRNLKIDGSMPDLMLLDVFLPDVSGEEIAIRLKSEAKTRSLPIILISGNNNLREIAKRTRADGYLEKPFELTDVVRLVEKYLQ